MMDKKLNHNTNRVVDAIYNRYAATEVYIIK